MKKIQSLFINMLLGALLGFAAVLSAQDAGIDFDFKDKPLDEVIGFLIEAYNMPIAYQDQQIRGITINSRCENCSQDQAIQAVLQSTPISAYQLQAQIILTRDTTKRVDGERNRIIGRVIDAGDRSSLPYANIIVKEHKKGTSSGAQGEFILEDLPTEPFVLKVLYIGYREREQLVTGPLNGQDTLTIALNEDYLESDTIAVLGRRPLPIRTGELPGKTHLDVARMKNIPSISSAPLENAVRSLPGISNSFEVPTQFSFFGGRYDQNLFMLDGIPFYRPYHYYGLVSAFHPRAVEQADVYMGYFPVRFDNFLSGVIDATVNTVPENRFNWGLDADMLGSGGFLEWPVTDRLKLFLAARSSWPDIGSSGRYYRNMVYFGHGYNSVIQDSLDHDAQKRDYFPPTRFYDLLGKTQYAISRAARASFTFYYGKDLQGATQQSVTDSTGNTIGISKNSSYNENVGLSTRFRYDWNEHFNSTLTWAYHHTLDHIEKSFLTGTNRGSEYNDKLSQQYLQLEGSYTSGNFRYDAGLKWRRIALKSRIEGRSGQAGLEDKTGYFQMFWQDPGNLDITAGLLAKNLEGFTEGVESLLNFTLRLALGWQVLSNLKLTAAANGIFHANLDAVLAGMYQYSGQKHKYESFVTYNNYNPLNTRIVTFANEKDLFSGRGLAASYVLGMHSSLFGSQIDASAWYTGYPGSNLYFDYDPEKVPKDEIYSWWNLYPDVASGDAFATGYDISLRKQYGTYQGQLSYRRSFYLYRLFQDDDHYNPWSYNLNREHQIKFTSNVTLKNWELALSETWASATGEAKASAYEWLDPLPRGLPYYNRTDLSVQRSGLRLMDLNWTLKAGVLNIFNRPNIRLRVPYEQNYDNITYGLPRTFYAGLQVSLH